MNKTRKSLYVVNTILLATCEGQKANHFLVSHTNRKRDFSSSRSGCTYKHKESFKTHLGSELIYKYGLSFLDPRNYRRKPTQAYLFTVEVYNNFDLVAQAFLFRDKRNETIKFIKYLTASFQIRKTLQLLLKILVSPKQKT